MSQNKLTKTRAGWLYEASTDHAATWETVSDGWVWSDASLLLRVTAPAAQFGASAYTVQRTNPSGDFEDVQEITLDLAQRMGNWRIDAWLSEAQDGPPAHTVLTHDGLISRGNGLQADLFEEQLRAEARNGVLIEHAGRIFRGTKDGGLNGAGLQPGGYRPTRETVVLTSRAQWHEAGVRPQPRGFVKVAGRQFRIAEIETNDPTFRLVLSTDLRDH